ncbi:MAG: hypothetical protein WEE20_12495, partial [Bacteroidota bacterium]
MSEDKTYYRRHLPHYHPEGATFHVVFRLAGSLPLSIIRESRQEKERLERELKTIKNANGLKQRQNDILEYDLFAYCIMPNHVH